MRFVDRGQVQAPPSLTDPAGAGPQERIKAQLHYGAADAAAYSFKAYKSPDVIQALEALFHGKCAYCESSYAAVHPMDVEHYRPKGGVFEAPGHRGYWWLAAEWTNLLPSCIDCNRRRYQDLYRIEAAGGPAPALNNLAGKQNLFPIAGHQHAPDAAAVLDQEDALLIDPCRRDPAVHLTWSTTVSTAPGVDPALAVPRTTGRGDDPYARASIDVYGLNRSGLVDARTDLIRKLAYELEELQDMIRDAADERGDKLSRLLGRIDAKVAHIAASGNEPRPYSACAAEFLRAKLSQLLATLEALRQTCRQRAIDQQG